MGNRQRYQGNEYIEELGLEWMDFHNRQYDPQLGRFLSVDPLADAGGQQVLSPYHAMACNPVSMMDPLGLQVFGPANPMTVQDPAAMARAIAPTLLNHMPGGGLWDLSNMNRYIASLPKDLQAEAWMLYLSGGATGASTFQSRLGDLLTERAAKGNERKGSWASDMFGQLVLSIENGHDVFDEQGNLMTFLDEQQVYGFNYKNSIYERWMKWMGQYKRNNRNKDAAEPAHPWVKKLNDMYGQGTFLTSNALSFVGTKTGKVLSMGGAHVWRASTYSAQKALLAELAYGSNAIKGIGKGLGYGGLIITGVDMYMNGVTTSNSIDLFMGGVSFYSGLGMDRRWCVFCRQCGS